MGWQKANFDELEKAIKALDEVTRIQAEMDIEKLKQIEKIHNVMADRKIEQDGLEKDASSSTSI